MAPRETGLADRFVKQKEKLVLVAFHECSIAFRRIRGVELAESAVSVFRLKQLCAGALAFRLEQLCAGANAFRLKQLRASAIAFRLRH